MITHTNWFESWFDSHYYHLLYKNRNDEEAHLFIDNIHNYLMLPTSSYLLDLACGKGRHSIYLADKGYKVLGLDLSKNSIDYAKKFEKQNLKFNVHDMREVYKPNQFDVVFSLFSSFGYFENHKEHIKMIQSIHQMLKPNGTLVFDFLNIDKALNSLNSESKVIDGITFNTKKVLDSGYIKKNIEVLDKGIIFNFEEKIRVYYKKDLQQMFTDIGFAIDGYFGDYNLASFDSTTSERLIIIARKHAF